MWPTHTHTHTLTKTYVYVHIRTHIQMYADSVCMHVDTRHLITPQNSTHTNLILCHFSCTLLPCMTVLLLLSHTSTSLRNVLNPSQRVKIWLYDPFLIKPFSLNLIYITWPLNNIQDNLERIRKVELNTSVSGFKIHH